jgi:hypothetical protein
VEERRPLLERAVGRDDERPAVVALADDLVDVHRLLALERAAAEVVDDQERSGLVKRAWREAG